MVLCVVLLGYFSGWSHAWASIWILIMIGICSIVSSRAVAIVGLLLCVSVAPVLIAYGFVMGKSVAAAGTYCLLVALIVSEASRLKLKLKLHESKIVQFEVNRESYQTNNITICFVVCSMFLFFAILWSVAFYSNSGNQITLQRLELVSSNSAKYYSLGKYRHTFTDPISAQNLKYLSLGLPKNVKLLSNTYSLGPSDIAVTWFTFTPNDAEVFFSLSRSGVCYAVMQIMSTKKEPLAFNGRLPVGTYYLKMTSVPECGWNENVEITQQASSWKPLVQAGK
jgi:hypothetical protein